MLRILTSIVGRVGVEKFNPRNFAETRRVHLRVLIDRGGAAGRAGGEGVVGQGGAGEGAVLRGAVRGLHKTGVDCKPLVAAAAARRHRRRVGCMLLKFRSINYWNVSQNHYLQV